MSVYSYPQSTVIDEITFRKTEGGHNYAYLHAASGASPPQLQAIIALCEEHGWQCTPYSLAGKPVLQIEGVPRASNTFIALLRERGWVQGKQAVVHDKTRLSFSERMKKRSLAASGAFYLVGDASFTRYGYKDHNPLNIAAGILYGAGTLSLLGFGRKDQSDLQIRDLAKRMAGYMKDHGIDVPPNCSLEAVADDHKKGLLRSADDLFRRYPSEMMNLFFAAAGVCIAVAASKSLKMSPRDPKFLKEVEEIFERNQSRLKQNLPSSRLSPADLDAMKAGLAEKMHKAHRWESKLDIGLGAMTAASGLFVNMVKEKKPDPDTPPKKGAAALWQKIQSKPLALAGIGYMVSTMCHAVSTGLAWKYAGKDRRGSVPWRASFVVSNIIAEILLAISSKGHGEGVKSDKTVDETIIALSADLIVKQPTAMQEQLIGHVARFLGKPDVLAIRNEDAERRLREQVAAMQHNPWICKTIAPNGRALPEKKQEPSLPPSWQSKVAGEAPQPPQLSA